MTEQLTAAAGVLGADRSRWRMVAFGDVVRQVKITVDPDTSGLDRYVAGEHMESDDLHVRRWGTIGKGYLGPAFHQRFSAGQVLYGSRRTYLRKVAFAEFDGICANTTFVLEPADDQLLPELLPFIMQTEAFTKHSVENSKGSVNPYVNWGDIASFRFALPPRDEQRRIAEVLWAASENVDLGIELVLRIDVARKAFFGSILSDLETSDVGERFSLSQVCSMQNGQAFPSTDYQGTGVRLLRPGNLASRGYLDWTDSRTQYLPVDYVDSASDYIVRDGDILINLTAQSLEDGFVGRVCLARGDDTSLLNQRIGRITCNERVNAEYVFRLLQTREFRTLVEARCEGSKIRHLYWRHFEDFEIPVPSLDCQINIASIGAALDSAAEETIESLRDAQALLGHLRSSLIG